VYRALRAIKVDYCFDQNNCLVSLVNNNKFILDQSNWGMQMRACMVGIVVVVTIGLMWSVAAMSNLVPVDGSDSAVISRPAE